MRLMVGVALALIVLAALAAGGVYLMNANRAHPAAAVIKPTPRTSPTGSSAPSAAADDPCRRAASPVSTTLAVENFGRVLADPRNCHVFVSSPAGNAVVVVDYSGKVVKTFSNEYGAGAMVIDGSTLYVALTTSGSIDVIDTQTLTRTRTLASGLVKPRDLAMAGGRLWTTSGECTQWTLQLASVDPATGKVTTFDADRSTNLGYCAAFATTHKTQTFIVAWDSGLSPGSITVLDVSSGKPIVVTSKRAENLGNLTDAAITPGGDKLITASGSPYEFDQWSLSGVTRDGVVYPGKPYPNSIAISPVHEGLVATGVTQSGGNVVAEYLLGKPAAVATMLNTDRDHNLLYPRGLAFSADGALIVAITGLALDGSNQTVTVNVLPGPNLP